VYLKSARSTGRRTEMHKKIYAISKMSMYKVLCDAGIDDINICTHKTATFISIIDPGDERVFKRDNINVLTESFWDISIDDIEGIPPINEQQAMRIVRFILSRLEATKTFIVHCTAGISRSGAVARFIFDLLQSIDYSRERVVEFESDNRQIIPNVYVSKILREAYNKIGGDHH